MITVVAGTARLRTGVKGERAKWVNGERKNTLHNVFLFAFFPFRRFAPFCIRFHFLLFSSSGGGFLASCSLLPKVLSFVARSCNR
jgi:hypothetical protein